MYILFIYQTPLIPTRGCGILCAVVDRCPHGVYSITSAATMAMAQQLEQQRKHRRGRQHHAPPNVRQAPQTNQADLVRPRLRNSGDPRLNRPHPRNPQRGDSGANRKNDLMTSDCSPPFPKSFRSCSQSHCLTTSRTSCPPTHNIRRTRPPSRGRMFSYGTSRSKQGAHIFDLANMNNFAPEINCPPFIFITLC